MNAHSRAFGEHARTQYDELDTEFISPITGPNDDPDLIPAKLSDGYHYYNPSTEATPDWRTLITAAKTGLSRTETNVHPLSLAVGWIALSMAAMVLGAVLIVGWIITASIGVVKNR